MPVFTMLMTVPQVFAVWVSHQAAGVSVVSWCAHLFQPFSGFGSYMKKARKEHLFPCAGWVVLNAAAIVGAVNDAWC
jgi:hypothetical protein